MTETERPLPLPDADTSFFWEATARGELHILRCRSCGTYVHPPRPACSSCGGGEVAPERVSGRGVIHSYTITHRPLPGFDPPFNVVLVELEEQRGLRLVSNLVDGDDVTIGARVEAVFERFGEVTLPLFRRRES